MMDGRDGERMMATHGPEASELQQLTLRCLFQNAAKQLDLRCVFYPNVNTMWRKILYSGFETCFGPSTQGAGTKTHLKSRFCAILTKRGAMLCVNGWSKTRGGGGGRGGGSRGNARLESSLNLCKSHCVYRPTMGCGCQRTTRWPTTSLRTTASGTSRAPATTKRWRPTISSRTTSASILHGTASIFRTDLGATGSRKATCSST